MTRLQFLCSLLAAPLSFLGLTRQRSTAERMAAFPPNAWWHIGKRGATVLLYREGQYENVAATRDVASQLVDMGFTVEIIDDTEGMKSAEMQLSGSPMDLFPKAVRIPLKFRCESCGMVATAVALYEAGKISMPELVEMLAGDVEQLCHRISADDPAFAEEVKNHQRFMIGRPRIC